MSLREPFAGSLSRATFQRRELAPQKRGSAALDKENYKKETNMANRKQNEEKNKQTQQELTQPEQTPPDTKDTQTATQTETLPDASEDNAGAEPKLRNDTVLVSLKHPQGIRFPMPDGRRVFIKGNAETLRGKKKGILPEGGFGLTPVSAEDWEYIRKTYGGMNTFKNGLIFASGDFKDADMQQAEHDEIKSGLEPVNVGQESSVDQLKSVSKADEQPHEKSL